MLAFRRANESDREDMFLWRNDPETVAASFVSEPVKWEDHCNWFDKSLKSDSRYLYIIELDDARAGVVRFDIEGEKAEISITIDPRMRGRGIGTLAIAEGCKYFARENPFMKEIFAQVKPSNKKSIGAFLAAGFKYCYHDSRHIILTYLYP